MPKKPDVPLRAPVGARMIREGQEEGGPTIAFDPERRCNFHLDALGQRLYHGTPDGFEWNADGTALLEITATVAGTAPHPGVRMDG